MKDDNQKKQVEGNNGVSSMVAAVTGAIVGAGVAVAATLALKNGKNQEKIKKIVSNAGDFAGKTVKNLKKEPDFKKTVKKVKEAGDNIKKNGK